MIVFHSSASLAVPCSPICRLLLGDVHLAKPKSDYERATNASFAIQNRIGLRTINAIALREGA
jgi:hypothetical protein